MLVSPCINTNVSGLQCGRRVAAFLYCLVKYGAEKTVCVPMYMSVVLKSAILLLKMLVYI